MNTEMKPHDEWYREAIKRPAGVSKKTIKSRLKVAEGLRQISADLGHPPTEEMIADELLLITGRMDKEEFNQYLFHKSKCGSWNGG